jgi:hypothetical protein
MAQEETAYSTYDAAGLREDLSDVIYNISPTETPFITMIAGKGKAKAKYHEWQLDSLAAVDTANAKVEGDAASTQTSTASTRVGNYVQISDKVARVTGTQEAVDKAGRRNEMAYQMGKRSKELKRDMEAIVTRNQASVAGDDSTARKTGSLEAWIETNYDAASDASPAVGGFSTTTKLVVARDTNGTKRAFTEAMLKKVIRVAWNNGGEPSVIMLGPLNKQALSAFTGGSTRTDKGEDKRLTAAVDVYVSDFGTHRCVPNRFQNEKTVFVLTPSLWKMLYLRPFRSWPLAKTGDTQRRQILVEWGLCSKNEAGSAACFDLTDS